MMQLILQHGRNSTKKLLNHKLSADVAETTSITELAHKIF